MSGAETSGYRPPSAPLEPLRSWHVSPGKGNLLMALGCGGFLVVSFLMAAWAFSAAFDEAEMREAGSQAAYYEPQYGGYVFSSDWVGIHEPDPESWGWEEVPYVDGVLSKYYLDTPEQYVFNALWIDGSGETAAEYLDSFMEQFARSDDPTISYELATDGFGCGEASIYGWITQGQGQVGDFFAGRRGRVVFYVEILWGRQTSEEVQRLRSNYCETLAPISN